MTDFDVVVLGAGSGGYAAALRAAQVGLRVALVERDKVGGTCLHRGCIPTKALLHAAEVADSARHGAKIGLRTSLDGVDGEALLRYSDSVVARLYKGLSGLVSGRGITVVEGEGRLVRDEVGAAIAVGDEVLRAPAIVLATGSVAATLGLDIDGSRVLTSEHALRLTSLPGSAIVLGGGVIGCEFASAWRSLGVDVTVVEALDRLVPNEEPEISQALQRAFTKRGIAVRTGTAMTGVEASDAGAVLTTQSGETLRADVVLVAVGRHPNTAGFGYAEAGVETERGCVVVDERLRTSVPGVWAVGDLVAGPQLAHRGFAHGMYVADEIAIAAGVAGVEPPAPIVDASIPRVTYSDPEIASVGLTEAAASELGDVATVRYDLTGNGRSQIRKTSGFVKVVRRVDGPVLGIHMIGGGVGELVGEAELIVGWEAYPDEVAALIHAHPTQDEALGEAMLALAGRPLHSHG